MGALLWVSVGSGGTSGIILLLVLCQDHFAHKRARKAVAKFEAAREAGRQMSFDGRVEG